MKNRMKKEKALTGVIMLALTMGFMPAAQAGSASTVSSGGRDKVRLAVLLRQT